MDVIGPGSIGLDGPIGSHASLAGGHSGRYGSVPSEVADGTRTPPAAVQGASSLPELPRSATRSLPTHGELGGSRPQDPEHPGLRYRTFEKASSAQKTPEPPERFLVRQVAPSAESASGDWWRNWGWILVVGVIALILWVNVRVANMGDDRPVRTNTFTPTPTLSNPPPASSQPAAGIPPTPATTSTVTTSTAPSTSIPAMTHTASTTTAMASAASKSPLALHHVPPLLPVLPRSCSAAMPAFNRASRPDHTSASREFACCTNGASGSSISRSRIASAWTRASSVRP